jgi:hypothetical protein
MKKSFSSMNKEEFEIVMKDEYAARKIRQRQRDIEQTEFYIANMQKQLRKDLAELKRLQEEV